jgi:hypothetical protein
MKISWRLTTPTFGYFDCPHCIQDFDLLGWPPRNRAKKAKIFIDCPGCGLGKRGEKRCFCWQSSVYTIVQFRCNFQNYIKKKGNLMEARVGIEPRVGVENA